MKCTILLLAVSCLLSFTTTTYSQTATITLDVKDKPVKEVLNMIEKATDFYFTYNPNEVNASRKVSLSVDNENVYVALGNIFNEDNVGYVIEGKHIALYKVDKNGAKIVTERQALQQRKRVTGTVIDEQGEPLIGVSVVIKGTNTGTVTNIDGQFEINVSDNETLEFSYVGYVAQSIPVGNNRDLKVTMREDAVLMDEVVVVGYSTKKRMNLTGAVSTVSTDALESRPVNNALAALQGEVPGMTISRYSGQPGNESFNMNVRGRITTNELNDEVGGPLVIIDGVEGNINMLNADDIESISVLKDAQASIYGARAAAGVFLITTKSGKKGKPLIRYSGNVAATRSSGMMKSPTNYEMAIMDNEANIHNGAAPMYTEDFLNRILNNDPNPIEHPLYGGWMLFFTNTDWMSEILETGFQHKHNLSMTGGGENSSYYLSAGYIDQHGVVKYAKDNNKRYSLRLNYDYSFFDRIKLETKVSVENKNRSDIGGVGDWVIGEGIFGMPNHPVYNASGNYFAQGGWSNAVAFAKEGAVSKYKTNQINTNFKLIGDLFSGMKAVLQAGINKTFESGKDPARSVPLYTWDDNVAYYAIANPSEASLNQYSSETTYRNYTGFLEYNKTFNNKHSVDVMGGASHEEYDYETFSAWRDGFADNGLWSMNLGSTNNIWNDGSGSHWSINSFFGRAGYSFDSKYLVEANLRYDGSSRFSGADSRWGFFPGFSAGWRISKESFMEDVKFVDELKIRASYGETGNQVGIGLYDFIQKMKFRKGDWGETVYYPFGAGSQTQSVNLDGMVAFNRRWETIINQNIGLDAVLFNSRLDLSFDYFWKRNKDMLIPVTYPSLLGSIAPYSNSGEMKTHGFELAVTWRDKIGIVNYFARFILSDAKDKVTNYGGLDTYELGKNKIREGYPMNSYFAYEFDGLIRTQAELDEYKKLEGVPSNISIGDARFKDLNGDGKISTYGVGDDGDVKYVGNTTPRYNYGFTLGADVKGFDFSIFFQGVGKRTLFRTGDYAMPWSDWWRQPAQFYYLQTWNEDRQDAYYPRLSHGDIRYWNYQASTLQKINAAYLRLKNIQIGYTLPKSLTNKISIAKARVYFSGQDLWEQHKVKGGWDPESADWGGNYPFQRYYSFGIDVTF
ncbi:MULTISPECIES: TonB-dependent receptor [unclassified Parabacteroides]|nr:MULTISPECIES: TonB-dependent receptor [unclassified Parabacteroides]